MLKMDFFEKKHCEIFGFKFVSLIKVSKKKKKIKSLISALISTHFLVGYLRKIPNYGQN